MNALKSLGSLLLYLVIMAGFILLVAFVLIGLEEVANWLYPKMVVINSVVTFATIVFIIPLLFIRKTREYATIALLFVSYIFGVTGWLFGFLVTYFFWGFIGLVVGLFLGGVGVVPIGMLASVFNGEWIIFANLTYIILLTYGSRFLAHYMANKIDNEAANIVEVKV